MINLFRAYQAGARARKDGVVVGDNPFNEHSDEFWQWMRGWLDGAGPNKETATHG
jgi:hypothetical protein